MTWARHCTFCRTHTGEGLVRRSLKTKDEDWPATAKSGCASYMKTGLLRWCYCNQ